MTLHFKKILSGALALALVFTLQAPAFAVSEVADGPVTVRQWAAMLCGAALNGDSTEGNDCVTEAYRRGWLSVNAVIAPDTRLCRGALYQSAFAAAGLHIYDYSLYPDGRALSVYDNCLRVGAELGLCPVDAEPLELVTRGESAALLDALLTRNLQVREPPMLDELPVQNDEGINMNDYLLELRRVPEPVLQSFRDQGWTYTVDFSYLSDLSRKNGASCTGATDYGAKRIYVAEAQPTLHEFGHFLDCALGFPSGHTPLYADEAQSAVFLRDYALTECREYFAEYFAYYLKYCGNAEKAEQMERLTPETFAFFSALADNGWRIPA